MTLPPRLSRIATNEARFRDINDQLEQGLRRMDPTPDDLLEFVCECGHRDCEELIEMSFAEYEHVRRDSRQFAVVPGHAIPDAERVVEVHERYQVLEKLGGAVAVADAADSRASGPLGRRRGDRTS